MWVWSGACGWTPADAFERIAGLADVCELAVVTSERRFVVAVRDADRAALACRLLREAGLGHFVLPIRVPFHSSYIEATRARMLTGFGRLAFSSPTCPLVSCTTGGLVDPFTGEHFLDAVRKPLLISRTLDSLPAIRSSTLVDLSPGGAFASLAMGNQCQARGVLSLFETYGPGHRYGYVVEALARARPPG